MICTYTNEFLILIQREMMKPSKPKRDFTQQDRVGRVGTRRD